MQHVVVGSSGDLSENHIEPSIINNRIAGNGLFSIIRGLIGKDPDSESMGSVSNQIQDYYEHIVKPASGKLWLDSGGYSFIRGDLDPSDLEMGIDLYHSVLKEPSGYYDYIFSLDIPYNINSKYAYFNTQDNVYMYNRESLSQSIEILRRNPSLIEKFFLIYHFKTPELYQIWRRLENELSLRNHMKFRAIGGMVSIHNIAKLSISPFIATTFNCLFDYERSVFSGEEFRIHFLGINIEYDRFIIAFLERLIQHYLGSSVSVLFTYDTVKFKRSAMYYQDHICEFDGSVLHAHDPLQLSNQWYCSMYQNHEELIPKVKADLLNKASGKKHREQANLEPVTISSALAVDRFFEYVIDKYEMVDIMFNARNGNYFDAEIEDSLSRAFQGYSHIFSKNAIKNIQESLEHVYTFHEWYTKTRSANRLEQLSLRFITEEIDFPFKLI